MKPRKRPTLMPAIALATLGLMVALPTLSGSLHAASEQRYTTHTVRGGDTLWAIAAAHTPGDGDVQDTIDRITAINHLGSGSIHIGEHLRVPE